MFIINKKIIFLKMIENTFLWSGFCKGCEREYNHKNVHLSSCNKLAVVAKAQAMMYMCQEFYIRVRSLQWHINNANCENCMSVECRISLCGHHLCCKCNVFWQVTYYVTASQISCNDCADFLIAVLPNFKMLPQLHNCENLVFGYSW